MVSYLVMLLTSIVQIGLQTSLFVNIDQPMPVPGSFYASFMMYCGFLHFLEDMVLLPKRYKRRLFWPMRFVIELTLSIAVMEVLALVLWARIELIICLWVKAALCYYGNMCEEECLQHEATILGSLLISIAALFWMSAVVATEPLQKSGKEKPQTKGKSFKQEEEEMQHQEDIEEQQDQTQQQTQLEQLEMQCPVPSKYLILADAAAMSSQT
ncbi:uncharacterized protein LOC117585008 [Drosophila guanche]|uniref:Uncharacterized protein n=1 Tax=Drosophila guanche TaxID=7266 RepID=A0A3B0JQ64_DROGU|nr:uncharacterized protein LOC117585008 [Drosophila guanche]SPP83063.1 Hypothetical predicted protein [Drosophila guanche]